MMHERDPSRNGCDFDVFFMKIQWSCLLEEPYQIYNRSIAIPLYSRDDYRDLGLKRVLCNLGAEDASDASDGIGTRISKSFRNSITGHV